MREGVGALGGGKGVGALGGEKGAGVICVCGCAKIQKSCYLRYLTPEYNRPKMVAVMKRYMTLRKIDRDKIETRKGKFCLYTVMYNVYSNTVEPQFQGIKTIFKLNWCFRLKVVGIGFHKINEVPL